MSLELRGLQVWGAVFCVAGRGKLRLLLRALADGLQGHWSLKDVLLTLQCIRTLPIQLIPPMIIHSLLFEFVLQGQVAVVEPPEGIE